MVTLSCAMAARAVPASKVASRVRAKKLDCIGSLLGCCLGGKGSGVLRHVGVPAARLAGVHQAHRVAELLEVDLLRVDGLHAAVLDGHDMRVEDLAAALRFE